MGGVRTGTGGAGMAPSAVLLPHLFVKIPVVVTLDPDGSEPLTVAAWCCNDPIGQKIPCHSLMLWKKAVDREKRDERLIRGYQDLELTTYSEIPG